jgi:hypothetical protein
MIYFMFWWERSAATGSDECKGVILNPDAAIRPRRRAESASRSGDLTASFRCAAEFGRYRRIAAMAGLAGSTRSKLDPKRS